MSANVTIVSLREYRSGSLRAFCGVRFPSGLELYEVTLHAQGDPEYFPIGVKHRYSR